MTDCLSCIVGQGAPGYQLRNKLKQLTQPCTGEAQEHIDRVKYDLVVIHQKLELLEQLILDFAHPFFVCG